MNWQKDTEGKFNQMLAKIPIFLRDMAKNKVSKKAEALAAKEGRAEVTEKDVVDAFFLETPFGFHGPMKADMEAMGINYQRYGYER